MSTSCLEVSSPHGRVAVVGPHIIAIEELPNGQCQVYTTGRAEPLLTAETYDALLLRIDAVCTPSPP